MKTLSQTNQFTQDIKRMQKRGKDLEKIRRVVSHLASGQKLPPHYRDHPLTGPWKGTRDCHVEPDWVLIYTMNETHLKLIRNGTHADLFE